MNTLEDLKAKFPGIYSLHEAALTTINGKVTELTNSTTKLTGERDELKTKLTTSEKTASDGIEKIKGLEKDLADKTGELTKATEKLTAADAAIAQTAAEKVDTKRQSDVKSKVAELVKENKFAAQINKIIEKRITDKAFDVKAAEDLVKEKIAEYAEVAGAIPKNFEISGIVGGLDLNKEGSGGESNTAVKELAKVV